MEKEKEEKKEMKLKRALPLVLVLGLLISFTTALIIKDPPSHYEIRTIGYNIIGTHAPPARHVGYSETLDRYYYIYVRWTGTYYLASVSSTADFNSFVHSAGYTSCDITFGVGWNPAFFTAGYIDNNIFHLAYITEGEYVKHRRGTCLSNGSVIFESANDAIPIDGVGAIDICLADGYPVIAYSGYLNGGSTNNETIAISSNVYGNGSWTIKTGSFFSNQESVINIHSVGTQAVYAICGQLEANQQLRGAYFNTTTANGTSGTAITDDTAYRLVNTNGRDVPYWSTSSYEDPTDLIHIVYSNTTFDVRYLQFNTTSLTGSVEEVIPFNNMKVQQFSPLYPCITLDENYPFVFVWNRTSVNEEVDGFIYERTGNNTWNAITRKIDEWLNGTGFSTALELGTCAIKQTGNDIMVVTMHNPAGVAGAPMYGTNARAYRYRSIPAHHVNRIMEWIIPMMGISGFIMLMFSGVWFIKSDREMNDKMAWFMVLIILGFAFIVVWIFPD